MVESTVELLSGCCTCGSARPSGDTEAIGSCAADSLHPGSVLMNGLRTSNDVPDHVQVMSSSDVSIKAGDINRASSSGVISIVGNIL